MLERLLNLMHGLTLQATEPAKAEPLEKAGPFSTDPAPCLSTSATQFNPFACTTEAHKSALAYVTFLKPSAVSQLQSPDLSGLRLFSQLFPPSGSESEKLHSLLESYWDGGGFQMIENGIANWKNIIQRNISFFSDEDVEKIFAGEAIKLGTNFGLGNTVRSIDLARLPQLGFDFDKIHNFQERK